MRDGPRHRNRLGDLADPKLIETLTEWLEASGARELEIDAADGQSLAIVIGRPGRIGRTEIQRLEVKAPFAGLFLPVADLAAGAVVEAGEILGLMEIGLLRLPVVAPAKGVLRSIHAENGQLLGYGTTLFTLEAAA